MQTIRLSVAEAFSLHAVVIKEITRLRGLIERHEGHTTGTMRAAREGAVRADLARLEALLPRINAAGRGEAEAA